MNKKFGGFTESQLEAIARKMGYKDSMEGFNTWAASSPEKAAKLSKYHETARKYVEEGASTYAQGGKVEKKDEVPIDPNTGLPIRQDGATNTKTNTKVEVKKTSKPPSQLITEQAINKPETLVTQALTKKTDVNKNQFVDPKSGQADPTATKARGKNVKTSTSDTATANVQTVKNTATANQPKVTDANTYDATQVSDDVDKVLDDTQAVKGTVSKNAQVEAATALPSANATVQGQLESLMKQFEGGQTPAWAAGAMRMANTVMAGRGLGGSTLAGSAITQAAMESAISIAAQDAATFSQFEMQNLNNRQQARLQNAQSFLQMDLANLDVANQTNLFKAQSRIQSMFTDQAADNAAKQFNATSQNQTDQFFSSLKSQVEQFNAAQKNAMAQFNVGQVNTMSQFNAAQKNTVSMFNTGQLNTMKQFNAQQMSALSMFNAEQQNARDQFNAENRLIIDQSNAQWRRQIATQDNAQINETNRLNAQLSTGLTTAAYNNLFQQERDLMSFAFTAAENANQRSHEIVMQKMTNKSYKDLAKAQQQAALGEAAGKLISSVIDGIDWGGIF